MECHLYSACYIESIDIFSVLYVHLIELLQSLEK